MTLGHINDIAAFVAAAETGSFVAAARVRSMTRSGIAKSVSRLENRLGVRLFNRTTRSLGLTDSGSAFFERYSEILSDLEDAEFSLSSGYGEPQGMFRLTAPATFGRVMVLPLLNQFLNDWPRLRAEASLTDRVNDIIAEGFDLAIRIGEMRENTSLIARTIATQRDIVVGSPAYLDGRQPPRAPEDLTQHDCLSYVNAGQHRAWRFSVNGEVIAVRPKARLALDGGEALRDAAISGAGLAFLPTYLVTEDIVAGRLREVLEDFAAPPIPISAIYPSRRHLAPKVRRFIDLITIKSERS
ncbi:LysR family transcriptional regulator [Rhizobium leguminosarum]|uniref:LysR family transcriptional regulator n=1 Tax=Rhizobium leguminosarum TaxID=384 RepID=UPI001C915230|nr:LysR family transcriptional regulator [Rhizobium leguminosarum]MBY2909985.1 LysR family transcriptional regulator [Rhizobium leguminosarum]